MAGISHPVSVARRRRSLALQLVAASLHWIPSSSRIASCMVPGNFFDISDNIRSRRAYPAKHQTIATGRRKGSTVINHAHYAPVPRMTHPGAETPVSVDAGNREHSWLFDLVQSRFKFMMYLEGWDCGESTFSDEQRNSERYIMANRL